MTPSDRLRILVLPAKAFPCDHAMLETVLASLLPARGHRVEWVMASRDAVAGTVSWNESEVHVVPAARGGLLSRAKANVALMRTAATVGRRREVDIVFVRNAVRLALVALWLRRTTGARFVFQFSFPVAERTLMLAGRTHGVSAARRISAAAAVGARRVILRRADLVITISESMRRQVEADGVSPTRVEVLPLAAQPVEPSSEAISAVRAELGLRANAPLVLYFGAIARERQLEMLIDVAASLRVRHPDARWVLLGPSATNEAERLRTAARRRGLEPMFTVCGPVPRRRVPAYIAAASVTVSPIPSVALFEVASPTKVVESLAAGTPVVATPIEDQAELIRRSGGGIVAPFEVEAFAGGVLALLDDPEAAHAMGRAGRAFVAESRTWEQATIDLEAWLLNLVAAPGGSPALR